MENGHVDDGSAMVTHFVNTIEDVSSNRTGFEN